MPDFEPLHNDEDLQDALASSQREPIVFYKHSATCGLSARARREMERFAEESEAPIFEVVVQEARPVSNTIADRFSIRHETPQAIVVYQGQATFDVSHGKIKAERVENAITQAAA